MIEEQLLELIGANMDIDLSSGDKDITWQQAQCPWNAAEKSAAHKCAVKNTTICKYFHGIKRWDIVLCSYPQVKS
jgi:hypothetical protein